MFKNLPKNKLCLVIFAGCLLLIACGTKGPLYIPEQRYPDGVPKEQGTPKDNETKEINKGVNNNATKKDALQASIHEASKASI